MMCLQARSSGRPPVTLGGVAEGIITTTDAEFRGILDGRSQPVQAIALAARRLVIDVLPQAIEVVWPTQRSAGYGTGPRKMTDHFAWILPYEGHVALAFPYGVELDDPAGLLQGTGARIRNVRLASLDDVARPELRRLLENAVGHKVPPPPTEITVRS
jgi:hypothetical protein